MNSISKEFISSVEKKTGLTQEEIINMPLDEMRSYFEKRNGRKTMFTSDSLFDVVLDVDF